MDQPAFHLKNAVCELVQLSHHQSGLFYFGETDAINPIYNRHFDGNLFQEAADQAKTTEQKREEQSAAGSVLSKVVQYHCYNFQR